MNSYVSKEREEESKRMKLQKITEEVEKKRLATESSQRERQRIQREIEERELQEAQALLCLVKSLEKGHSMRLQRCEVSSGS